MASPSMTVLFVLYTCTVVVTCRDTNTGFTQESSNQMDECFRMAVPTQVYILCCLRDNNCSIARYQNEALECISRIASMANDSLLNSQRNTQSSSSRSDMWSPGEVLRQARENCRRLPNSQRQQICIRNEISKYCQSTFYRPAINPRLYSRRGSVPSSAWDPSIYSDSYPVDQPGWRRRIAYPDASYYPKTYVSRRLYGRDGGSRLSSSRGSSSYSYGDSSDEDEEDFGYGSSSMGESYSK